MPAKASTRHPASAETASASASSPPCKTGMPRLSASAMARSHRADGAPRISKACALRICTCSGARIGPAGITRPLPRPRVPSITTIERFLRSDGFWNPSSITMAEARAARAIAAPATRSGETMVGASCASSSGLVAHLRGAMARGVDTQRLRRGAAIAAAGKTTRRPALISKRPTASAVGVLPAPPMVR